MKKPTIQMPTQKGKPQSKVVEPPPKVIKQYRVDDYVRWDLPK